MNKEIYSKIHYLTNKELYKDLSIVFTCYNVRYEVSCAINTFLEFYPYLRENIYIFDDFSTDNTREWARENGIKVISWTDDYLNKYPVRNFEKFCTERDFPICYSYKVDIMYNCIFDQCKTKYLLLCDADIIFFDYFLDKAFEEMKNGSKLFSTIETFGPDLIKNNFYEKVLEKDIYDGFRKLYYFDSNLNRETMHRFHLYCSLIDVKYFRSINTKIDDVDRDYMIILSFPPVCDSGMDFTRKIFNLGIPYSCYERESFVLHLGFRASFKKANDLNHLNFMADFNNPDEVTRLYNNPYLNNAIKENPLLRNIIEKYHINIQNTFNEYEDKLIIVNKSKDIFDFSELNKDNFTIAIAGKNVLRYIKLNVDRILYLFPQFKDCITIFDDGSKDGTKEWAKENGFNVITWKYLPEGNDEKNISVRVNMIYDDIMMQIQTKYLSILDSDIIISDPNYFIEMANSVIKDKTTQVSAIIDVVRSFREENEDIDYFIRSNNLDDYLDNTLFTEESLKIYSEKLGYREDHNKGHVRMWFGFSFMNLEFFKRSRLYFDYFDKDTSYDYEHKDHYARLLYGYFDSGTKFLSDLIRKNIKFHPMYLNRFSHFVHFGGRGCYQCNHANYWGYAEDERNTFMRAVNINSPEEFRQYLRNIGFFDNLDYYFKKPEKPVEEIIYE